MAAETMDSENTVELFTDGACLGNPGPGGWAAILRYKGTERELSGGEPMTTNNRMEMMAVIQGLRALTRACRIEVFTDSQYVQKGITEWIKGWKKRGWKTADKKPVKNADLWQRLEEGASRHEVQWHWVRGHNGHDYNERADILARNAVQKIGA